MSTSVKLSIGLATLLLLGGVALFAVDALGKSEESFCNADALIGPNDELFGRDGSRSCQFVDDDGDLLERFADGRPLCYEVDSESDDPAEFGSPAIDCDEPGPGKVAKPPG